MKKWIQFFVFSTLWFNTIVINYAQISAPLANSSVSTVYTNGATNDLIYIFCSSPSLPNTGTLVATPTSGTAPYTFSWYSYNTGTNNWQTYTTTNGATSTISGLASGGYFVTITDAGGNPSGCHRAWVFVNQTIVDAGAPINGCSPFSLTGTANAVANFVYYNPPANPLIISNTTQIQVCFNATHTWVSDLGFYLVGPPSCGSPTVLLSPNPGAIGQGTICNSGDNVVNLCFSTASTNTLNVCNPAPATLSGTYGRYGPGAGTAINWSPLYGCDANSGGWTVQIYDCIGGDVGTLTNASISIVGASTCGPINVNYNSGTISSNIADNSCSAGTASSFTVPPIVVNTPITLANSITSVSWSTGATTLSTSVSPAPLVNTWYYLTATDNFGCSHTDSVLFTNTCVCNISSVTATSSAVNCVAETFSISGQVTFTDPPLSGTLTVQNCSGDQVTFNAPFTSPISYVIPNISADGTTNCQVTAVFSADPLCTATSSLFTEPILPSTPSAGNNSPICEGATINLTSSTVTGATYTWTGPNGFNSTSQNPSITNSNLAMSGVYSVTATIGGCVSLPGTTTVTVNPIPATPTAGSNSAICEGATLNLTSTTITNATYSWTGPNGFVNLSQNPSLPNATTLMSGVYNVTATVNGCASLVGSTTVTVNPIPTTPTVGSNSPICEGTTLNLTSNLVSGGTYSWTGPNTFTSTTQNPSIPNATTIMSGVYSVSVTVNGCVSLPSTTNVIVNSIPTVPNPSIINASCTNPNGSITIGGNFTSYSITGINPIQPIVTNTTGIFLNTIPGTYSIIVSNNGCNSLPFSATVSNIDLLDCDGDGVNTITEIANGTDPNDPCSYLLTSVTLPQQGIWLTVDCDGDGVTNQTELSNGTDPNDPCSYLLTSVSLPQQGDWLTVDCDGDGVINGTEVMDGTDPIDHCSFIETSITLPVTVVCIGDLIVVIPNIFTPNGDGSNDTFFLNITNGISIKASIFNRWGKTIHEWNELTGSWNGTFSGGKDASEGTYYYVFEIEDKNGEIHLFKGHFLLNR